MARYKVNHRYKAGIYGPWDADTYVELTEEQADHVNRDSPGCLSAIDPDDQAAAKRAKAAGAYDPAAHTVDEVNAKLAEVTPEEAAAILAAERAGKARKTILEPAAASAEAASAETDQTLVDGTPAKPDSSSPVLERATKEG